jgi:hypothetical protein
MTNASAEWWPWLIIAGLGLYHGINPAMGWLFAVALGLHRKSRGIVLLSLVPIALGHAASVAAVLFALLTLGLAVDRSLFTWIAAGVLVGWAAWHAFYGHRRRVLVGMQTGLAGILVWSFVTASAHGAGLMLVPALIPLCGGETRFAADTAMLPALAALGVHTAAMLATIAAVSIVVYHWIGVDFLRRGWINLDLVWIVALLGSGIALVA